VNQTDASHRSDAELLASIHDEPVYDAAGMREHLAACARCAARQRALADQDATIAGALAQLDDPLQGAVKPRVARRSRHHWVSRGLRIAGAGATVAVAAAALVVPPVHRWIFREVEVVPNRAAVVPPRAPALASGIAVPASPTLTIVLRREQTHGNIAITWTAAGDVTFGSRGGTTAYEVASGQVAIDNQVPADEYQIHVPRSVQQLRIVAGTRVLLRWPEDSAQRMSATEPDRLRVSLDRSASRAP
jgi:hypothetical protein